MTLSRWGFAFMQLGALLLAIGLLPGLVVALLFPGTTSMVPALLSLSVAPLGGICLAAGVVTWTLGKSRRNKTRT